MGNSIIVTVFFVMSLIGTIMFAISAAFMSLKKKRAQVFMSIGLALMFVGAILSLGIRDVEASNTRSANIINSVESFINQNFDGVLPSEMWEMRRERSYQGFVPRPVYSEYRMALTGEFHREFQIWLSVNEITVNTNDITRLINNGRLDLRQFIG